jgi:hypothetical protein
VGPASHRHIRRLCARRIVRRSIRVWEPFEVGRVLASANTQGFHRMVPKDRGGLGDGTEMRMQTVRQRKNGKKMVEDVGGNGIFNK